MNRHVKDAGPVTFACLVGVIVCVVKHEWPYVAFNALCALFVIALTAFSIRRDRRQGRA